MGPEVKSGNISDTNPEVKGDIPARYFSTHPFLKYDEVSRSLLSLLLKMVEEDLPEGNEAISQKFARMRRVDAFADAAEGVFIEEHHPYPELEKAIQYVAGSNRKKADKLKLDASTNASLRRWIFQSAREAKEPLSRQPR